MAEAIITRRGGKGDASELNIYTQLIEPDEKQGIWLETNIKHKNVEVDSEYYLADAWVENSSSIVSNVPFNVAQAEGVSIGSDIFIFGGVSVPTPYNAYKYDTIADTYTQLTDIPFPFGGNSTAVSSGTDIYLIGANNYSSRSYNYKYNTLNDTYSELALVPYLYTTGRSTRVGQNIYLMGTTTMQGTPSTNNYKYSIETNSYTRVTNMPKPFNHGTTASVGSDIYIFGGGSSDGMARWWAYKYDTLTDSFTSLTNLPYSLWMGGSVSRGSHIYIYSNFNHHLYNILDDTYTQLPSPEYSFIKPIVTNVGHLIYLMATTVGDVSVYALQSSQFENNTVVLDRTHYISGEYFTELISPKTRPEGAFNQFKSGFNDVLFFTDGDLTEPKSYYGNGEGWIQFKF